MKKLHEYTEEELDKLEDFVLWDLSIQDCKDKAFDKIEGKSYPDVSTIFDILDSYKKFCVKFGRHYNEDHIFNKQCKYWKEYLLVIDKDNKTRVQNYWKRDET